MRRTLNKPGNRPAWRLAAITLLVGTGLSLAACKPRNQPTMETSNIPVETGTVDATMAIDSTASAPATATSTAAPAAPVAPGGSAAPPTNYAKPPAPAPAPKAPVGFWPAKVGSFSKSVSSPVWYPKYIPKGYALDSVDVVELDPGSGLTCDAMWVKGQSSSVDFMQGSPNNRDAQISSSLGKVKWGTETADITRPDQSSPIVIVYSRGGNLAELQGDVSDAELKAIAASMVAVK